MESPAKKARLNAGQDEVVKKKCLCLDKNSSDFEELFHTYMRGKVSNETLKNCKLIYVCKLCQKVHFNLSKYLEHYISCKAKNSNKNQTNSSTTFHTDNCSMLSDITNCLIENMTRPVDNGQTSDNRIPSQNKSYTHNNNGEVYPSHNTIYPREQNATMGPYGMIHHEMHPLTNNQMTYPGTYPHVYPSTSYTTGNEIYQPYLYNESQYNQYQIPNVQRQNFEHTQTLEIEVQQPQISDETNNTEANDAEYGAEYSVVLDSDHFDKIDYKKLTCLLCERKFKSAYVMRQHLAVTHLGFSRYKCGFCDFKTTSEYECKEHALKIHNEDATKKSDFNKMFSQINVRTPSITPKRRKRKQRLAPSQNRTEETAEQEDECTEEDQKAREERIEAENRQMLIPYRDHLIQLTDEQEKNIDTERLVCLQCNEKCFSVFGLRQHYAVQHLGLPRYKCKRCDFTSNLRTECRAHSLQVHKIKVSKSAMRSHFYEIDSRPRKRGLSQPLRISLRTWTNKANKDPNTNKDSGETNKETEENDAAKFTQGQKVATGVSGEASINEICQPVICSEADASETYFVVLTEEQESKMDMKKNVCLVCDKKFKTGFKVRQHLAIMHLSYHRYKCKSCSFKATSVAECKKHSLIVHKEQQVQRVFKVNHYFWELSYVTAGITARRKRMAKVKKGKKAQESEDSEEEDDDMEFESTEDEEEEDIVYDDEEEEEEDEEKNDKEENKKKVSDKSASKLDNSKSEFKCLLCGCTFMHEYFLKQHMTVSHLGCKKWKCKLCAFQSDSFSECQEHLIATHKDTSAGKDVKEFITQNR